MNDHDYDRSPDIRQDRRDEMESGTRPIKRRGPLRNWLKVREFETAAEAKEFIKQEECWSLGKTYDTRDGVKVQYRCNVLKQSEACPASVYLLYHADHETKVTLYRTEESHSHDESARRQRGLPDNVRSAIEELCKKGVKKPTSILTALRAQGLPEPSRNQLTNFLQYYRKTVQDEPPSYIGQFEDWCTENSHPDPDDPHKPFVVRYETGIGEDGTERIRIFMTTPRLLDITTRGRVLHILSTTKINWEGYPVIVLGTTNQDRQFHPAGLAIMHGESSADFTFVFQSLLDGIRSQIGLQYQPEVLVADNVDAVTDACSTVFGNEFRRVDCWTHMIRAIDRKLMKIGDTQKRQQIRRDICHLHLCTSEDVFDAVAPLFVTKWSNTADANIDTFLEYFRTEWMTSHNHWHVGSAPNAPCTTDGLVSTIGAIKRDGMLRSHLPLPRFLGLARDTVLTEWSTARDPADSGSVDTPGVSIDLWTKGYQWAIEPTPVLSELREDGGKNCYVPADGAANGYGPAMIQQYVDAFTNLQWASFDQYVNMRNSLWLVVMPSDQWRSANCTCPDFFKEYICKHIVGLAIRNDYCDAPDEAKRVPRKRGRPMRPGRTFTLRD